MWCLSVHRFVCFHLSLNTFDFTTKYYLMFSFVTVINPLLFTTLTFIRAYKITMGWRTKRVQTHNFDLCFWFVSKLIFPVLYIKTQGKLLGYLLSESLLIKMRSKKFIIPKCVLKKYYNILSRPSEASSVLLERYANKSMPLSKFHLGKYDGMQNFLLILYFNTNFLMVKSSYNTLQLVRIYFVYLLTHSPPV